MANEAAKAQNENLLRKRSRVVNYRIMQKARQSQKSLERGSKEGETPVLGDESAVCMVSKSRVAWDCSPNWEINFF